LNLADHTISLNLLQFSAELTTKEQDGKKYILDPIRKKYLVLQPEEFVRQLCIIWLISTGIRRNQIQVEKSIKINGLYRRFDIVVYDKSVKPSILVECKAPEIKINQSTFDQIAAYQVALNAPYLVVTNGITSFVAQMKHEDKTYRFFSEVPDW
jgi:hypothetical protein